MEMKRLQRPLCLIVLVKLYVLTLLYILFLRTGLRDGDAGFLFRRPGESLEERAAEIERSFAHRLAPYDGQWYLDIAAHGYRRLGGAESLDGRHPPANLAFFPLLPGLLRGLGLLGGGDFALRGALALGILLSAIGALTAFMIARELRLSPALTAALLLAFPTAVFQFALYTEGLFLCFSSAALLFTIRRRAGPAIVFALLAGLTRPQGVLLALPLFWEFLRPALARRSPRAWLRGAFLSAAPLSGYIVLSLVSFALADSGSAFLEIQTRWGRSASPLGVFHALGQAWGYNGPPGDLLGLAFGIGLLPVVWRRLPTSLALYGTGFVLMPLLTGTILSYGRFMSVSIPHFLALAALLEGRRAVAAVVIAVFACLQTLAANGLIGWYLVG